MKNKLFWPIAIIAIIIIIESLLLLTNRQIGKQEINPVNIIPSEETMAEDDISFSWLNDEAGGPVLVMTANKGVAIDAIDLYIAYKGTKVNSVKNLDELPKPSFSKVSTEKSLVVMNYLISEALGFSMETGQSVKVAQLNITADPVEATELSVDPKTQVVENGTAMVLPFNSENLIINGTSL